MLLNNSTCKYCVVGLASLSCLTISNLSQAQTINSDGSLPTQVQTSDNLNYNITGGSQVGDNLFHSFENFSVPENGSASFINGDVQNIINRVTGSSISNIDGLIEASGDANVLLINPNGIIFGRNASLNIGGSFLATTANGIQFADDTFLSATDSQTSPILTISTPIGLQFGETPGSIRNQSQANRIGLAVQPGNTLALVGGDIFLEGGTITASAGRIELGSVDSFSFVSLAETEGTFTLGYENVSNFQDIQLTQDATVDTSGFTSSGNIHLRGRNIVIANNSSIFSTNLGDGEGGIIDLEASESLELDNNGRISTLAGLLFSSSSGSAGDILIKTERLIIRDSLIDARTSAEGLGGDIIIVASEFVEIDGNDSFALITTVSDFLANGNAGNIRLTTSKLFLRDGGQITSSTSTSGNAGSIFIGAAESIEISGQGENSSGELVSSAIFSETSGRFVANTGNGGSLEIDTGRLSIQDGGIISVGALNGSLGQAGTLEINASESVELSGTDSTILASSESPELAGNLNITTDSLNISDEATISVSANGSGGAGDLIINAESINLDNGNLSATTQSGEQGNIILDNANLVLLNNNSSITTNASTDATGGNITIDTEILAAFTGSQISSDAVLGNGGDIEISAEGIFLDVGIEEQITANSELGIDGTVTINNPEVDPTSGLIELQSVPFDAESILARDPCAFIGDKIAGGSSFTIIGRGGLPPEIDDPIVDTSRTVGWATYEEQISSDGTLILVDRDTEEDILEDISESDLTNQDRPESHPTIQQAQGWIVAEDGSVWLTAQAPQVTPQNSPISHPGCQASSRF